MNTPNPHSVESGLYAVFGLVAFYAACALGVSAGAPAGTLAFAMFSSLSLWLFVKAAHASRAAVEADGDADSYPLVVRGPRER